MCLTGLSAQPPRIRHPGVVRWGLPALIVDGNVTRARVDPKGRKPYFRHVSGSCDGLATLFRARLTNKAILASPILAEFVSLPDRVEDRAIVAARPDGVDLPPVGGLQTRRRERSCVARDVRKTARSSLGPACIREAPAVESRRLAPQPLDLLPDRARVHSFVTRLSTHELVPTNEFIRNSFDYNLNTIIHIIIIRSQVQSPEIHAGAWPHESIGNVGPLAGADLLPGGRRHGFECGSTASHFPAFAAGLVESAAWSAGLSIGIAWNATTATTRRRDWPSTPSARRT